MRPARQGGGRVKDEKGKPGNEGVSRGVKPRRCRDGGGRPARSAQEAACGCVPDVTFCVMVQAAATHGDVRGSPRYISIHAADEGRQAEAGEAEARPGPIIVIKSICCYTSPLIVPLAAT